MSRIIGWKKTTEKYNHIVYSKIDSPLKMSISQLKPQYWNINMYEKRDDSYRFLGNLVRGIKSKKDARKYAIEYMERIV